jgi:hypothetical protein
MATAIYTLTTLTALVCTLLLLRAYARSHYRLLFWSGLCFAGLTLNNILLVIDKIVLPTQVDLSPLRSAVALLSMGILLYGMIWDTE